MSSINEEWVEIRYPQAGSSPVVLADGKYYSVSTGDPGIFIFRHDRDGVLDKGFGVEGVVALVWPGDYTNGYSLSLQGDGLMLSFLAGSPLEYSDFALYKLDAKTGKLDQNFGNGGLKITPIPETVHATARIPDTPLSQAPQLPDGKHRQLISHGIAQFHLTGELDSDFAGNGVLSVFPDKRYEYRTQQIHAHEVAGTPEGFIFCGNFMLGGYSRGWVGAIRTDGELFRDFGGDGSTHFLRLPGIELANLVVRSVIQVQDKFYAAGAVGANSGTSATVFMYRLKSDGTLDESYNDGKPVWVEAGHATVFHIGADEDGVLIGASGVASPGAIYRIDASGNLDKDFGGRGWLNLPVQYQGPKAIAVREHAGSKFLEVTGYGYLLRHLLR